MNFKNYQNKVKTFIIIDKETICIMMLLLLWFFLFYYNFITLNRLFNFFIIMLFITFYKKLLFYIKLNKPIKNIYILILLIKIDSLKLILFTIIKYIYVFLFDIKDAIYMSNWNIICIRSIALIEWLIKLILINPILLVLHKFYYVLYLWHDLPLKTLFISRFFGIIVSVLVFTPIINYILFNYNWLYIYLIILIISVLDDIFRHLGLSKNKYFKYIGVFLYLLKINKDILFIIDYRNKTSIFAILISKGINEIKEMHSLINVYSYSVNNIYKSLIVKPIGSNYEPRSNKEILDYNIMLIYFKILCMKESIIKGYNTLFKVYSNNMLFILNMRLFYWLGFFYVYKLQKNFELEPAVLDIINHLEGFVYRLCKVILFYFFSISKILGMSNENIYNYFVIDGRLYIDLNYDFFESFNTFKENINYNDITILKEIDKKIIQNHHFFIYDTYYEQVYFYLYLYKFYNYKFSGLDTGVNINKEYDYIYNYIILFKECFKIITINVDVRDDFEKFNKECENNSFLVYKKQMEFKSKIIAEWEVFSQGLSKENFYDKNYACLAELNLYTKSEFNRLIVDVKKE